MPRKYLEINGIQCSDNLWSNNKSGIIFRNAQLQKKAVFIDKHPARRMINVALLYSYYLQLYNKTNPYHPRSKQIEWVLDVIITKLESIYCTEKMYILAA